MSLACPVPAADVPAMAALLATVDCDVRRYAEAGFLALAAPGSWFPAALTGLMTIGVALFGYRLLFGFGPRLSEGAVLAVKIGAVLALTLQWPLFQTLVFDLAYRAPLQVARTAAGGGAADGDPLGGAQAAYDALTRDAAAIGRVPSAMSPDATARARAAEGLEGAARTLFLATAGALAAALVTVGVLSAVGPLFVAMLLLGATWGLFVGWVRALLAAALAPMLVWGVAALEVEVLRPALARLAVQSASLAPDFAQVGAVTATVDAFALATMALLVGGLVVALGFRPRRLLARRDRTTLPAALPAAAAPILRPRAERLAETLRAPAVAARAAPVAASAALTVTRRLADRPMERMAPVAERRADIGRRPRPTARRGAR